MHRWLFRVVIGLGFLMFPVFFGGFLYAQTQTALPDLALDAVSLLGDPAVVYRNDGATISSQPYVISFQWISVSGTPQTKWTLSRSAIGALGRDSITWDAMVTGVVNTTKRDCYGGALSQTKVCYDIPITQKVTQSLSAVRLKRPQSNALLAVTLDASNQIKESNEANNYARVGNAPFRGALPLPTADLTITRAAFDAANLVVLFQNQSAVKISNQPFDVGFQWLDKNGSAVGDRRFFRYKNLAARGVEVIDSRTGITTLSQTGLGLNDVAVAEPLALYIYRRPNNAVKLSITVDARQQILEVNKTNNVALINAPPQAAMPELTATLAVKVIPSPVAAASSSMAFILAFVALLSGAYMIHGHTSARRGLAGFFAVFPLLFTSARNSYMFLRKCGPEGCAGSHFNRHAGLKQLARASAAATVFTGAVKVILALAFIALTPSPGPVFAAVESAHPGDKLEVALTVKNIGKAPAQGVVMKLPCPSGSMREGSAVFNYRPVSKDPAQGIPAPDINPGISSRLSVRCAVNKNVGRLEKLELSGSVVASYTSAPVISSTVTIQLKKEITPQQKPDLTVDGAGFLPLVDIVEKDRAPFEAVFSAIVSNPGKEASGAFRARVRVDLENTGTWNVVSPALVEMPSIVAGGNMLVKFPLQWDAPVGIYTFEICVDPGRSIDESDETNNCATDRFTLKVGEEPAQEEEMIEE